MKKFLLFALAVVLVLVVAGCESSAVSVQRAERSAVATQDAIYAKNQPIPTFNYSLPRDLLTQFYVASTSNVVRTWSAEVDMLGEPIFMTESIGYPIPMDTQLTNPAKGLDGTYVLPQSEPNGLYTSPNTNATIIMTVDGDGKVAPVYCEQTVLCWPFPVRWDDTTKMFTRVEGSESSISLDVAPPAN